MRQAYQRILATTRYAVAETGHGGEVLAGERFEVTTIVKTVTTDHRGDIAHLMIDTCVEVIDVVALRLRSNKDCKETIAIGEGKKRRDRAPNWMKKRQRTDREWKDRSGNHRDAK